MKLIKGFRFHIQESARIDRRRLRIFVREVVFAGHNDERHIFPSCSFSSLRFSYALPFSIRGTL